MRFCIERHGPSATLSLSIFHYAELIGGVFVHYCKRPLPVRAECEVRSRIKAVCVYSLADWQAYYNAAAISIHDDHFLVAASNKQTSILLIHRHAGRSFARRER